ncbi:hypothetical protein PISMIDRAFT_508676 [Pisolithus microcarpus 441]|uniref:Uncharacterized protein n=1 Tax=Pisolithus microcarpus 441 TaxID=765257 RepID=A0A0C9Y282_9AGAM|nr:hypothetical protein PISMIDRAFT_508676 [Pisolithus microcarpus 441]
MRSERRNDKRKVKGKRARTGFEGKSFAKGKGKSSGCTCHCDRGCHYCLTRSDTVDQSATWHRVDVTFQAPRKCILSGLHLAAFQSSDTHNAIVTCIEDLNNYSKLTDQASVSPVRLFVIPRVLVPCGRVGCQGNS